MFALRRNKESENSLNNQKPLVEGGGGLLEGVGGFEWVQGVTTLFLLSTIAHQRFKDKILITHLRY